LKKGINLIEISFKSKPIFADYNAQTCKKEISGICPSMCNPDEYHGFCNVNFLRTE
jgi:hypothetical protein